MTDCYIYKLPNELLLQILTPLPTPTLLPLTPVSTRLYTLILRILSTRLFQTSTPPSHSILLECYHPTAKLTEPPYPCTYNGTTPHLPPYDSLSHEEKTSPRRLGELRNTYSRFRPYRRELETGGRQVLRPPGDIPGTRTFAGTIAEQYAGERVTQILSLEEGELFTQLCAVTNLVKLGPRSGLFSCFIEVEDGRVWVKRDWLKRLAETEGREGEEAVEEMAPVTKIDSPHDTVEISGGRSKSPPDVLNEDRILWVSPAKNTGLRFRVREKKFRQDTPILMSADEDPPVSYEIEYDGKSCMPQS